LERPGGLYLHYLDEGQGPPVLMVHGNPAWSFMYRALIKNLSSGYRCLVPDHIGMGLSSRPKNRQYGFRFSNRLNDLGALMDSLELTEPVHVIVHDWGGPIGLGWAGFHAAQVASVTIMNTGLRLPPNYTLPGKLRLFRSAGLAGQYLAGRLNLFIRGLLRFGSVRPLTPAAAGGWTAPYRLSLHRRAIGRFIRDIPLKPSDPSFGTLQNVDRAFDSLKEVPVFLVWGMQDFVFTEAFLADFKARRPDAPVLALPRAGHLLLEDEPDLIAGSIRRFLGRTLRPEER
jgi:haloalkane dehalogenase